MMNPNLLEHQHHSTNAYVHSQTQRIRVDRYSSFSSIFNTPSQDSHKINVQEEVNKIQNSFANRIKQQRESYESKLKFLNYFKIKYQLHHEKHNHNHSQPNSRTPSFRNILKADIEQKENEKSERLKLKMEIQKSNKNQLKFSINSNNLSKTFRCSNKINRNIRKTAPIEEEANKKSQQFTLKNDKKTKQIKQTSHNLIFENKQTLQNWMEIISPSIYFPSKHRQTAIQLYERSQNIQTNPLKIPDIPKQKFVSDMKHILKYVRKKKKQWTGYQNLTQARFNDFAYISRTPHKRQFKLKQKRYSANNYEEKNTNDFESESKRKLIQNSHEIPSNLLKTLQLFYTTARNTQSGKKTSNCLKLNLNHIKNNPSQFSDQKIMSCQSSATPETSSIKRKGLRICEKMASMQQKRNRIKNQKKNMHSSESTKQQWAKQNKIKQ